MMVGLLVLTACDNKRGTDGLKKKAQAEYETGLELEREKQRQKASLMEADLVRRKRVYEKVGGEYSGRAKVKLFDNEEELVPIVVKLHFAPQIPPEVSGRVRELSEIEADFSYLKHFVHGVLEIEWSKFPYIESCEFEVIHNMKTGQALLKADQCSYYLELYLSSGKINVKKGELVTESSQLTEKVSKGENINIDYLQGAAYFSNTGRTFPLRLKRQNIEGEPL